MLGVINPGLLWFAPPQSFDSIGELAPYTNTHLYQ